MIRHTLKISQHLLQDFQSVPEHFGTLCINGLKAVNKTKLLAKKNSFTDVWQGPKYTSAEITDVLETFPLMPLNPNDSFVTHLGSFDKITRLAMNDQTNKKCMLPFFAWDDLQEENWNSPLIPSWDTTDNITRFLENILTL